MKSKIFTLLVTVLLFSVTNIWGQYSGPGSNWYFGDQAGVTWCTLQANGDPMYLMDGLVDTNEGVATISDNSCNLLFYSDGIVIWNSIHQVMSNTLSGSPGGSLTGDPSSTQSAVICPKPLDPNTYYIFTVDANIGSGGLAYSKVDMTANGGLGDVDLAEKNITLFNPSTEKIAAVNHQNGSDIWVITHQWNNNQFNAYSVTSTGVDIVSPVVSNVGVIHTGTSGNTRGYMKASPNGDMVALGIEGMNIYELFSFNPLTGQLSDAITLDYTSNDDCYGVEFSVDQRFLYGSERWGLDIHQWDVSLTTPAAIIASHQIVATLSTSNGGALQLAPDQMIYCARNGTDYLGRIMEPTQPGTLCNYVDQAILLGPNTGSARDSNEGLPTFIATFFNQAEFTFDTSCDHDTVTFFIPNPQGLDNAYWNFDWPTSNPNYHYVGTEDTVEFIYSAGGIYTVELITERDNDFDTVFANVPFSQTPVVNLGPDVTLCDDEILTFDLSFNDIGALDGSCDYFWEANLGTQTFYDSLPTYLIDKPGIYTCTVYADSICGQVTDILQVEYNNMLANLGVDVTEGLCVGDIHILDATYSNTTYGPSTYSWNTGSNQPTINVTSSGIYSVTIVNGLCTDVDSIYVHFDNPLTYPLGPDANLCSGSLITLSAGNNGSNYAWSTGMFSQTIDVDNPGTYSVTVTNACGQIVDDIILSPLDIPDVDLGIDFTICEGTPENIDAYVDNSTYVWSDGQVTPQIAVFYGGLYSVTVTNECGSNYDEIFVYGDTPLTNFDLGSDTAVCSGFELDAGYPNMEYYWSNNETTQIIEITQSDDYGVDVTNACGTYSDFIHIDIIELNIDLGPDTVMCPGTTITLDAQNPGSIYSWSNGAPTQTIDITQPGQVWVMVTNICETNSDTLNITLFDDILDLGIDTTICENFLFVLDAQHPGAEYTWSTGETTQTIEALQTGLYALTISHYCGNLNDEIDIVVNPAPVVDFGTDTLYLPGGNPIVLDPQANGTSFIWSNDSTGSTTTALYPNTYSVTVTNEFGCEGEGSVIVMYKIGIDKIEAEEKVLLYPNPVQNKLFISFNDLQINEIRIYNSIGSLISQIKNVENPVEISTNNLAEGVYFVKIRTSKDAMIIKPFSVVR